MISRAGDSWPGRREGREGQGRKEKEGGDSACGELIGHVLARICQISQPACTRPAKREGRGRGREAN